MLISSVISLSFPFIVNLEGSFGYWLGFVARVALGMTHSPTFPALQGAWTTWAPIHEKSRLVNAHFVGVPVGSVMMSILGGRIGSAVGWRPIFWTGNLII